MKKFYEIIFVAVFMLTCNNVFAFDGERKGFIIGGGIGAGYLSNTSSFNSDTDSRAVFLTNFKIGYAPSNTLEIYYISKASGWGRSDITFILALSAIAATFYFDKETETGWFISGGIGLSTLDPPLEKNAESSKGFDLFGGSGSSGFGFFGGSGYEFSSHWSVEFDLLYSTITEGGADFNSFGVLLTVNVLAF